MQDFEYGPCEENDEANKPQRAANRKQTEKKRRDRFNALLNELAEAVTCGPVDKLDKTTILRHVVNFFRKHDVRNKTAGSLCPPCVTAGEFGKISLDCLDCFVLVLDRSGCILFASDDALSCMGFVPIQLVGNNFFNLVHDEDKHAVYSQLLTQQQENGRQETKARSHVMFSCKLNTGAYKNSTDRFELVHCYGQVYSKNNINCLIMLVKSDQFPGPNKTLTSSDSVSEMFSTKLDLTWKYTSIDLVTTLVIGYFPSEIIGRSEYELCHPDDLNKLLKYHEVLLRAGKVTTCYYRLLTKAQSWIWVRTSCCVNYSHWNSKPECVTCITSAVSYSEVCLRYKQVLQNDLEKFKRFRERGIKRKANELVSGDDRDSSAGKERCLPVGFSNEALKFQLPSGLTSNQLLLHLHLREQYTRLSRKMQRHVEEMKRLKRKMDVHESGKDSTKQLEQGDVRSPDQLEPRTQQPGGEQAMEIQSAQQPLESHNQQQLQVMVQLPQVRQQAPQPQEQQERLQQPTTNMQQQDQQQQQQQQQSQTLPKPQQRLGIYQTATHRPLPVFQQQGRRQLAVPQQSQEKQHPIAQEQQQLLKQQQLLMLLRERNQQQQLQERQLLQQDLLRCHQEQQAQFQQPQLQTQQQLLERTYWEQRQMQQLEQQRLMMLLQQRQQLQQQQQVILQVQQNRGQQRQQRQQQRQSPSVAELRQEPSSLRHLLQDNASTEPGQVQYTRAKQQTVRGDSASQERLFNVSPRHPQQEFLKSEVPVEEVAVCSYAFSTSSQDTLSDRSLSPLDSTQRGYDPFQNLDSLVDCTMPAFDPDEEIFQGNFQDSLDEQFSLS